jgi:hypothetical protein
MSPENITIKFPPGEVLGLKQDRFKSLLEHALREYSDILLTSETKSLWPHTVYQKNDKGEISSIKIPAFPLYERINLDKEIKKKLQSGKNVRKLLDYIWNRGAMPYTFSGPDPKRESWECYVVQNLLNEPLGRVLDRTAHNEAIRIGCVNTPTMSLEDFEKLQDELILRFCHDQYRYIATCPLFYIIGEPGTVWKLSDEISLCVYTEEQKLMYLSRTDYYMAPIGDSHSINSIIGGTAVLQIIGSISMEDRNRGRPPKLPREVIREQIEDRIDVVKLALTLVFNSDIPPNEDLIICEDIFGDYEFSKLLCFRRDGWRQGEYNECEMTTDREEIVSKLTNDLFTIQKKSHDLKQAIWYWGRSSLAPLPRDILLEAVIGLESLLVHNPGESSYRFRLHGAALLSGSREEVSGYAKKLNDIYGQRSKAAHGSKSERIEQANAYLARTYLGKAIEALTQLDTQKVIDTSTNIAKQIEKKVLEGAVIRDSK